LRVPSCHARQRASQDRMHFESPHFARSFRANSERTLCSRTSLPRLRRRPLFLPHSPALGHIPLLPIWNPQLLLQFADISAGSCAPLLPHPNPANADRAALHRTEIAPISQARARRQPLLPSLQLCLRRSSPSAAGTSDSRSQSRSALAICQLSTEPWPP